MAQPLQFAAHLANDSSMLTLGYVLQLEPPLPAIVPSENQERFVALDPGIRTFVTGHSEDNVFDLDKGAFARIARLCCHMDDLISRMFKVNCAAKCSIKISISRMCWKAWDLIDELHYKSIRFLLDRFEVILLPAFEGS
ncbi:MAG: hypothetical protein WCK65_11345 [Rhodospirillaceae bacterium]